MGFQTIELDLEADLATVYMRHAGARLYGELETAVERVQDARARCLLLAAAGDWPQVRAPEAAANARALPFRFLELARMPVIAVIEGACEDTALELALACDLRVASESATFAMTQVGGGQVPSLGGTQRLPRLVGRPLALEMILLATRVAAAEALSCGLVNAITPPGHAAAGARRLAETIASRGPLAVGYAKEAVLRGLDMPLDQALRYETDLTVILQTTSDRDEGVRAFLEKRPPDFEGR